MSSVLRAYRVMTFSSELSVRFGLRGAESDATTTDVILRMRWVMPRGRSRQGARTTPAGRADSPIALGIVNNFILMKILTVFCNDEPHRGRGRLKSRWIRRG